MKRSVLIAALVLLVFASGDDRSGLGRSAPSRQAPHHPVGAPADAAPTLPDSSFPSAFSLVAWHPDRAVSIARSAGQFDAPTPPLRSDALTLSDPGAVRSLPPLLAALREYPVVALLVVDRDPPSPDGIARLPSLAADRRDAPAGPSFAP